MTPKDTNSTEVVIERLDVVQEFWSDNAGRSQVAEMAFSLVRQSDRSEERLAVVRGIHHRRAQLWMDWRLLWICTGPGWLMSLAYLDPGNLEADLYMLHMGGPKEQ